MGRLHPRTFLSWREAFGSGWPCLHLDVPHRVMGAHPCEKHMRVIRVVGKSRFKTGQSVGAMHWSRVGAVPPASSPALVLNTTRDKPRGSTSRWRLRPWPVLPPSSPRSPRSGVLTAWLSIHAALGVGARSACQRVWARKAASRPPPSYRCAPARRHHTRCAGATNRAEASPLDTRADADPRS